MAHQPGDAESLDRELRLVGAWEVLGERGDELGVPIVTIREEEVSAAGTGVGVADCPGPGADDGDTAGWFPVDRDLEVNTVAPDVYPVEPTGSTDMS